MSTTPFDKAPTCVIGLKYARPVWIINGKNEATKSVEKMIKKNIVITEARNAIIWFFVCEE